MHVTQLLRATAPTLPADFGADVGDVTVTITRADGTLLDEDASTTNNTDGTYDYTLDAQTDLDWLTAVWSDTSTSDKITTYVEIVGSHLFTVAGIRTFDQSDLASVSEYPASAIQDARMRVTDFIENATGRSWIPRFCRVKLAGARERKIYPIDSIITIPADRRAGMGRDILTVQSANDGSAVTTSNILIFDDGGLYRTDSVWPAATATNPAKIAIEYEYGVAAHSQGADRIAMILARDLLVSSPISDRAQTYSAGDLGTITFGNIESIVHPSSLREVTRWLRWHDYRTRAV